MSAALTRLIERADTIDRIVVEASGVADPARLADVAVLDPDLVPDAVVVMVDAAGIADQIAERYLADTVRRQLAAADLLVVNKTDLVGARTLDDIDRSLDDLAPMAARVRAVKAKVPLPLLSSRPNRPLSAPLGHDPGFRAVTVEFPAPPERSAFRKAMAGLPPTVLRAKGHVRFADSPAESFLVQKAGRQLALEPVEREAAGAAPDAVVLIGTPDLTAPSNLAACLGGVLRDP